MPIATSPPPGVVHDLAERTVDYVRRALGMTLDYTPETLPVLDHYLGTVPASEEATVKLVAATAGAYFGEVVRRVVAGEWDASAGDPSGWRLNLVFGLSFSPVGQARGAIVRQDDGDEDGSVEVPPGDQPAVESALDRKGEVPVDEYFSLCGRLETLVLVADVLAGRHAT